MKNTYRLLGIEWDHDSIPRERPRFVDKKDVEIYEVERNLFDLEVYERRIDITTLFTDTKDNIKGVIDKMEECDVVYINVDYEPFSCADDVISFFCLRVLQVISFVETSIDRQTLRIMASERIKEACLNKWDELHSA